MACNPAALPAADTLIQEPEFLGYSDYMELILRLIFSRDEGFLFVLCCVVFLVTNQEIGK